MESKHLTYRGEVKAVVALGSTLAFVTVHPEGQPTALYRLDADKLQLRSDPLPCGGVGLAAAAEGLWVLGTDGLVHPFPGPLKDINPPPSSGPITPLAGERLAILTGKEVHILSRKGLDVLQRLTLPEEGSVLTSDPGGQWLVVGTIKGNVLVYDCEDRPAFEFSASEKLHEGAVTALLFEPQELRFYSAGADNKLLSTHARGRLEPEDKGRGAGHSDHVVSLVLGPGDRFYSGSHDKTVKSWPRSSQLRPVTLKEGITRVRGLAVVQLHKKTQIAVVCEDNTFRFFALDEEGKFGDGIVKVGDAYARAKSELNREEMPRREAALRELASYNDTPAIEMIGEQIASDPDHGLRVLATELLGSGGNPRSIKALEKSLAHNDEAVRVAALKGLRTHRGENELQPLDLALKVEKADVGRLAVRALEQLASRDEQAFARLLEALNVRTREVRQEALFSLERLFPQDSPEANIWGLNSQHADLRRLTLVRLFQRQMIELPRVQTFVRLRGEDPDAEVRRTAFLLGIHSRPKLVQALRDLDPELQRQLIELESLGPDGAPTRVVEAETAKATKASRKKPTIPSLDPGDLDPLLQATASRALDTCLRGARGLAVLHDPRAFGLLLQLSREADAPARVEVCRALAALEDPRAIKRLASLLFDGTASVRDAAFTALQRLYSAQPLRAAELGLAAGFEDVRKRGLQGLISELRKKLPRGENEPGWQLLVQAINDSFPGVRSEAFKAALNLQIGGGGAQSLRFVLQSVHADVRLEVLTETMVQINEPWAWPLLLTFFNDPDPTLRSEAFEFALKKSKELEPLEAGLCSRHPDIRRATVHALIKKRTKPAQALVVRALADEEKEIRQLALGALIDEDAEPALLQVLDSQHSDVRVRAACALARHGHPAALAPLLKLATAPRPEQAERVPEWNSLVVEALQGLADLGEPGTLEVLPALLASKTPGIPRMAARTMAWCSRVNLPESVDLLRSALMHSEADVKAFAALGLALTGDPSVLNLVFSDSAKHILTREERLVAALSLGPAGEDHLALFLDDPDESLRNQTLVLLMLLEMKANAGTPSRCLTCLSALMPRVRLTAARGLEAFSDPARFLAFVVELFNDRGDETPWKVTPEVIGACATLLARSDPFTRGRTCLLLRHLTQREQSAWDQAWAAHRRRFANAVDQAQATQTSPAGDRGRSAEELLELAFGAYLGLVREQGRGQDANAAARVRRSAILRVVSLAQGESRFAGAALPVLIQCLGDPAQVVRTTAFEALQTLGLDSARLGAEALETGHTDLGVKGLEVLTAAAGAAEGQNVLERVMLTRKDEMALEAARLLMERRGTVPVARLCLDAAHDPLRERAVGWLAGECDRDSKAVEALRGALISRYQKVRETAAFALAARKDPAAYEALVRLLHAAQEPARLNPVIQSLITLGDSRTPEAFLDRLERDPAGTAPVDRLLEAAGQFQLPSTAPRLFALLERNVKWRKGAFEALLVISGFHQPIQDPNDEKTDREWERKQHPRRDDLLAQLLERGLAAGETKWLTRLLPSARWSRGPQVQPILAQLISHPDEQLRRSAVEALGFRLRKRGGSPEPLVKALQHPDPLTQLSAAEGLARAGRGEGFNVLRTAIEFMQEQPLRERAVRALGELSDPRALEDLLRLANDETSPLQAVAAEALGHMGSTEKGADIFRLLERFSRSGPMSPAALKGLRWLGSHDAWKLIRERADDPLFNARNVAIDLLGFNDDPASRDLLQRLITTEAAPLLTTALQAARRLWGEESLEPDYAYLQHQGVNVQAIRPSLDRVCTRGDAARILEVLPRVNPSFQQELILSVINRQELPIEAARSALSSADPRTCQLAAQIAGRLGPGAGECGPLLGQALKHWRGQWEQRRQAVFQTGKADPVLDQAVTPCVRVLLWAAGRIGVARDQILEAVETRPEDSAYRPLRLEAVAALGSGPLTPEATAALERAVQGSDPALRVHASTVLGRQDPARAAAVAERLLADHVSFGRLASSPGVQLTSLLRSRVREMHYQGVVLPHLLRQEDLDSLAQVSEDRQLPLVTRLGAVEGLAYLAREDAETRLLRIAQKADEDEELRKAAWRGLRRSRRTRRGARARQTAEGGKA